MIRSNICLLCPGVALATVLSVTPLAHGQEAGAEAGAEVEAGGEVDVGAEASAPRLAGGVAWSMRLEPALAAAISDPQAERTQAGFAQTVKVGFGLTRYLEIGPTAAFTTLPASGSMDEAGTAWAFGAGARVMRPRDAAGGRFRAASPWVDADLLYVRTGDLDRPGFSASAGVAVPIDERRRFWIGPFVRYFQLIQGERADYDNRDAKVMSIGISLEVGSGLAPRHESLLAAEVVGGEEVVAEAEVEPAEPVEPAPDGDGDGVSDEMDRCPTVAGPAGGDGCPVYQKVAVLPDKLEVKEKIAFEWDSAALDPSSTAALDEVAQALQDNPGFRVEVAGHASADSDGSHDAHNQALSQRRAEAVVDYLAGKGVARDRLVAKGFSSSDPAGTNSTKAGREKNRRVQFVVYFIILNEGSAK